jgi:hypothetical protein
MFVIRNKIYGFVRYTNQGVSLADKFTYNLEFAKLFPTQIGASKGITTIYNTHRYQKCFKCDFEVLPVKVTVSLQ